MQMGFMPGREYDGRYLHNETVIGKIWDGQKRSIYGIC